MQKSYETFIEELKSEFMKQPGLSENMHFEKEGGKYAPVGDRLLVNLQSTRMHGSMRPVYQGTLQKL